MTTRSIHCEQVPYQSSVHGNEEVVFIQLTAPDFSTRSRTKCNSHLICNSMSQSVRQPRHQISVFAFSYKQSSSEAEKQRSSPAENSNRRDDAVGTYRRWWLSGLAFEEGRSLISSIAILLLFLWMSEVVCGRSSTKSSGGIRKKKKKKKKKSADGSCGIRRRKRNWSTATAAADSTVTLVEVGVRRDKQKSENSSELTTRKSVKCQVLNECVTQDVAQNTIIAAHIW